MRAIVQTRFGPPHDVLEVRDVDMPNVGAGEVLVRVRAASVHADVWHVVTGMPWVLRLMGAGLLRPKPSVPGTDLAGVVEAVGEDARRFKVGDAVFGESIGSNQWKNGGAFAEYAAVPERWLALKPDRVTFEQAASVPTAGNIVLMNLQGKAEIRPGQHVLINGAGGGVGAIALQVAKARGARVTAVDSGEKLELLRALGADHVVDYRREDVTRRDARYDLVFDVASTLALADCKRVLAEAAVYVRIGHDHYGSTGRRALGSLPQMFGLMARATFDPHLQGLFSPPNKADVMRELTTLLEEGKLTPIVDRTFPLEEVAEAMKRLQEGKATGRILLAP